MKFYISKAKNKEWFFKLVAKNGNTLFHSETYKRKASCFKAIASLKIQLPLAVVIDNSK